MSHCDRPKLQAKRYNERGKNFHGNHYKNNYDWEGLKRGHKRQNDGDSDYNSYKRSKRDEEKKSVETSTPCSANDQLKNLRKNISPDKKESDYKVPVSSNNYSNKNNYSSPAEKKNTASERLKNLRKSLELEKTDKTKNKINIPCTSTSETVENVEMKELDTNQPFTTVSDRLHQFKSSNNNIIESPIKLETKINKLGFTNDWIAQTNFDGDTSSFMEVSTQARANETVANIDAIQADILEMDWSSEANSVKMFSGQSGKSHDVCIVVDTNVFLHNLAKVKEIIRLKISGATKPIVYVPWMVIEELDYIKDSTRDSKLKKSAYNAVKYINELLSAKHPRLVCQTVMDVNNQKDLGKSPDDKIISCCLQASETYEYVFILSNDINLKNKAMIHKLTACSESEILLKMLGKLNKSDKVKTVLSKMGMLCTVIIEYCVKECYGNAWSEMDMLSSERPWSFQKCLKIFKRYWGTVFKEKFLKQFLNTVDKTLTLLTSPKNIHICDDSSEFIDLVKMCVNLCVYFKEIKEYRDKIKKTITEITNT